MSEIYDWAETGYFSLTQNQLEAGTEFFYSLPPSFSLSPEARANLDQLATLHRDRLTNELGIDIKNPVIWLAVIRGADLFHRFYEASIRGELSGESEEKYVRFSDEHIKAIEETREGLDALTPESVRKRFLNGQ